jgi:hypothetical protein
MGKVIRLAAFRKWRNSRDLPAAKSTGVKGGIVIDWATAKPARPGEERGVIAIIKPGESK